MVASFIKSKLVQRRVSLGKNCVTLFLITSISSCGNGNGGNYVSAGIKRDTIVVTENVIIVGDTACANGLEIIPLFNTIHKFENYSVGKVSVTKLADIQNIELIPPSIKSDGDFRNTIVGSYKMKGVNFAGHYSLISYSCGSSCLASYIVDCLTGKVYEGPGAGLGYDYHTDSEMIFVNPPDANGTYDNCAYCYPEVYVFHKDSLMRFQ